MIPESFKVINRTYEVQELHDDVAEAANMHGDCNQTKALIRLQVADHPQESLEHTFFHELVHALLFATTKPELSADEDFVDSLGAILHQYEQTKQGSFLEEEE